MKYLLTFLLITLPTPAKRSYAATSTVVSNIAFELGGVVTETEAKPIPNDPEPQTTQGEAICP